MEKSWENFWTTGKVEDYLSYRDRVTDREEEQRQRDEKQKEQEGLTGKWDSR